jgi:hypothetical protein
MNPLIIEDIQSSTNPFPNPIDLPVVDLPRKTMNKTNQTKVLFSYIPVTKGDFVESNGEMINSRRDFIVPPRIIR